MPTFDPMRPTAGGIFFERNLRTKIFLRTKKTFELFERLWVGCFAENIVIICSTQLFVRVGFFRFSLQPPKCPESVFSKCGGFFFERTFEWWNEDIFRTKRCGVYKYTYRPAVNNGTAQPPVSLSNVAFSVLAHDSLPDTCTATWSFFFVCSLSPPPASSLSPSPASSSSCLPPLFVGVLLFFVGLFAFTCFFLALGAGTPTVALLLRCVASGRNTILPYGMPHGILVLCRDPIDCTGTAQFGLLLQDVSGYLHSPGAPLRNRHSSPRSPTVLFLEGEPCPRQCPSVWNLCLVSFVFIVIISRRRLLLLIFFSLFELRTLRTLTQQQLCLLLQRLLIRWPCSWSLLRLLCLPVRRENFRKVLYPSSGHNRLWIFAPHASTGRPRFFFREMQRGTTLAENHPCWQR